MIKLLRIILICLLLNVQMSFAQIKGATEPFEFTQVSKKLNKIETNIKSGNYTIESIEENSAFLSDLTGILQSVKKENEKELKIAQKQLEALGEEPQDGIEEIDEMATKRKEFKNQVAIIKSRIAETDILQVKIDELNILILNSRNQELIGSLVNKQSALIEPQNFFSGIKELVGFFWDIVKSPISWYKNDLNAQAKSYVLNYFIPIFFILIGAFWIGLLLKRLILSKLGYRADIENPRYGQKIMAAIFVSVAYGVIPSLIIGSFLLWLIGTKIFTIGFFGKVRTSNR